MSFSEAHEDILLAYVVSYSYHLLTSEAMEAAKMTVRAVRAGNGIGIDEAIGIYVEIDCYTSMLWHRRNYLHSFAAELLTVLLGLLILDISNVNQHPLIVDEL